ncbi:hypothetical protein [Paludisphaera rhizosphaerae]|uniref:hypothetical protein n=1 Tax=Paludisphaera rhizosphaerae TaxID=2711216 RepID=UPI0013ECD4EE|nr:hypothetical protein [Paludisphaera rhizosphaerae]
MTAPVIDEAACALLADAGLLRPDGEGWRAADALLAACNRSPDMARLLPALEELALVVAGGEIRRLIEVATRLRASGVTLEGFHRLVERLEEAAGSRLRA